MTDFARLQISVDATGMAPGEQALDSLARTGAKVEGSLKLNTKGIEKAMAALGNTMGGLGGTMKALGSRRCAIHGQHGHANRTQRAQP